MTSPEPTLFRGGIAADDRGDVSFVNDFDMTPVKRFYRVRNHVAGFIRAWHAHRREGKYAFVARGAALVCAVRIDNWEAPSRTQAVHRHVLSDKSPAVLWIPPGYANGFKSLTADMEIFFFSTSTVEESREDDVRYPADTWNPWDVPYR